MDIPFYLYGNQTLPEVTPEVTKVREGLPAVNNSMPDKVPGTPAASTGMLPGKRGKNVRGKRGK